MELRNYQKECCNKVINAWLRGERKQVISLPTGSGKTVIMGKLISHFVNKRKFQCLVITHLRELIDQTAKKFSKWFGKENVGVEMSESGANNEIIVVGSIQTLYRRALEPRFDLVCIDECHHAPNKTYLDVLERLGYYAKLPESKLLLGFTATTKRSDNVGLDTIFSEITYHKNILEMIELGWLVDIKGYTVKTTTDLTMLGSSQSDFNQKQLKRITANDDRMKAIIDAYKTKIEGKKTIIFVAGIDNVEKLAQMFQDEGIEAEAIHSKLNKTIRTEKLEAYRDSRLKIVINDGVLTEGFDDPSTEAIILGKPTKSNLRFIQMIGRGLRPNEGKECCHVIDICDISGQHSLCTVPTIIGLPPKIEMEGDSLMEVKEQLKDKELKLGFTNTSKLKDLVYKPISFLTQEMPYELVNLTKLAWSKMIDNSYVLNFNGNKYTLREDLLGRVKGTIVIKGDWLTGLKFASLKEAFKEFDKKIIADFPKKTILLRSDKTWRHEPASVKQIELLHNLGYDGNHSISKSYASLKIEELLEARQYA